MMSKIKSSHTMLIVFTILLSCTSCSKSGSGTGDGETMSDEDLALANQQRFGGGNIPTASEKGLFDDVLFSYDSAEVPPEGQENIRRVAEALSKDPTIKVEVEGHCDKRGTNEYNLALGDRRAKSVAGLLVSYGARRDQLGTVSYGEEIPLDPSDAESAYAQNRRAHFALSRNDATSSGGYQTR